MEISYQSKNECLRILKIRNERKKETVLKKNLRLDTCKGKSKIKIECEIPKLQFKGSLKSKVNKGEIKSKQKGHSNIKIEGTYNSEFKRCLKSAC